MTTFKDSPLEKFRCRAYSRRALSRYKDILMMFADGSTQNCRSARIC